MTESLTLVKWGFDEITPGEGSRHGTLRSQHNRFVQCLCMALSMKNGLGCIVLFR